MEYIRKNVSKKMVTTLLSMLLLPYASQYVPTEIATQVFSALGGVIASYILGQSHVDANL